MYGPITYGVSHRIVTIDRSLPPCGGVWLAPFAVLRRTLCPHAWVVLPCSGHRAYLCGRRAVGNYRRRERETTDVESSVVVGRRRRSSVVVSTSSSSSSSPSFFSSCLVFSFRPILMHESEVQTIYRCTFKLK